jgi:hypothetical protein
MQFIDLGAQRARIEDRLNAAVSKVVTFSVLKWLSSKRSSVNIWAWNM